MKEYTTQLADVIVRYFNTIGLDKKVGDFSINEINALAEKLENLFIELNKEDEPPF